MRAAEGVRNVLIMDDATRVAAGQWDAAIGAWLRALRAAGAPATTIELREWQIRRLAAAVRPRKAWAVSGEVLVAFAAAQCWQRETLRAFRSGARSFYRWAAEAGYVSCSPALALPPVRSAPPRPRPTPEDVVRGAVAHADARVGLMLRMAAGLGMRRAEVAVAHRDDLVRELDGWTMLAHGKGGKTRRLPVDPVLAGLIRRMPPGFLFPGRDHGHLSPRWVGKLVARALPGAWTMHTLRHRFASAAYAAERDVFAVQELLGHASPATTRAYVVVPNDALRRAVLAVAAL